MNATTTRTLPNAAVSGHACGPAPDAVASLLATLDAGLAGRAAAGVFFFATSGYEPTDLAGPISGHYPGAQVIGCSTAGEFTDAANGTGGISAVAFPEGTFPRVVAALGELSGDAAGGTDSAVAQVEARLGRPMRDLDPTRHVAIVLIDGMHGDEERVNERLGDAAPILNVIGGSAGDDLAFDSTWVAVGDRISHHGVALMVAEVAVPFEIIKSCSFTPSGTRLRITRADVANRTVLEFDGRPAAQAYAAAVGVPEADLGFDQFMAHPVGLMLDGQPWIRSPQAVTGDGLRFYAQILEGMEVDLMDSTDLMAETAASVDAAVASLGGRASGAVMFNCILRRLELDATGRGEDFTRALGGIPTAGFHTYGETWLGHVNQTITGVVFG